MSKNKELLKGTAETIVLQTLDKLDEAYGYQLVKEISKSSNNIFEFQEGTLYPLLYRLEHKNIISSKQKKAESGKMRRYYKLTSFGKKTLNQNKKQINSFVQGLNQVLNFNV